MAVPDSIGDGQLATGHITNSSPSCSFSAISLDSACAVRVFSEFRDTGNKYKMRIRSRVANLGDLKNPSLRQNVINGHVPPSRIAVMTSEVCYHQKMCEDTVASAYTLAGMWGTLDFIQLSYNV